MIARAKKGLPLAGLVTAFCLLTVPSIAGAQTPAPQPAVENAPAVTVQTTTPSSASSPYWALIAGYEWDTHGSSYGFAGPSYVHPVNDNMAWTGRVFGNYLRYEFSDSAKTTKVKSPGGSAALGLRFGGKNYFGVSAGPSVSWRKTEVTTNAGVKTETDETRWGANIGAEVYAGGTENLQLLGNYSTSDKYAWGRAAAKTQVTNRSWKDNNALSLGVEGIAQGNQDIKSVQFGGLVELANSPGHFSLMFRAGYKRSSFDVGADKTGPYFGINLYKRF